VVNGNLRLAGTSERGQLGGDLTVRQVFVGEKLDLLTWLIQGGNAIDRHLPGINTPIASNIRLGVQLNSGQPLRLEARTWNLLADLDLSVHGTLASPVETGLIHCRSGEAFFRGNRYRLKRGEIHMSNPLRTQPLLDVEGTTRVQRYELTVDISGPLDRLKVAYRSDPPLPTEDVLSLLALGFSQRQQERSTAAGRPLPAVEAGALLSQALSSQMSGRVQRLFGVSRIKVDPNVGGPGSPGGALVTFEQQVTRDLTLTYVTNTATSQYRIIQFEWAVSENASLIGVRDQNGILGVEVKFRKRFH
jgi:translocation and assembly module TamB